VLKCTCAQTWASSSAVYRFRSLSLPPSIHSIHRFHRRQQCHRHCRHK